MSRCRHSVNITTAAVASSRALPERKRGGRPTGQAINQSWHGLYKRTAATPQESRLQKQTYLGV